MQDPEQKILRKDVRPGDWFYDDDGDLNRALDLDVDEHEDDCSCGYGEGFSEFPAEYWGLYRKENGIPTTFPNPGSGSQIHWGHDEIHEWVLVKSGFEPVTDDDVQAAITSIRGAIK